MNKLSLAKLEEYIAQSEKKEILRLMTCGSVDDGKSTLIGRLLYDSQMIFDDQMSKLKSDSEVHGTVPNAIDFALLMDGLKAEREQGITIDVAYRYFSTPNRKFIVADTPGHEQYTRNMATGASTCDLAIILIDARKGVMTQTKRHAFIASLLGIKHVVVAMNKMDTVDYSQEVFETISEDFKACTTKLDINDLEIIPISALKGDNVVGRSENMPWYNGQTLMNFLDTVHIASSRNLIDMRFPVQYVLRPDANFRGFSGTVASGVMRPGDEVMVLPSRQKSRIASIITADGNKNEAFPSMAVTVTLDDEIDLSRGNMMVHPGNIPHIGNAMEAMVVWMSEEPLEKGREYYFKHTTKTVSGGMSELRYVMDVNTLHRKEDTSLSLNEIGRCAIMLDEPIAFDSYKKNRATGAMIIIDKHSNATVGAVMILDTIAGEEPATEKTEECEVDKEFPVVWLTGNTGAGKSTVAFSARDHFKSDPSRNIIVLDGDEMRETISIDESLSPEDRRKHNIRVARLARLLQSQGFLVLVSVIAPFEEVRKEIRQICDPLWVHVKKSGLEAEDKPYEEPKKPSLVIDNDVLSAKEAKEKLVAYLGDL